MPQADKNKIMKQKEEEKIVYIIFRYEKWQFIIF